MTSWLVGTTTTGGPMGEHRAIAILGCVLALTIHMAGLVASGARTSGAATANPIQLGIVGASGQYFTAEQGAGVKLVTIGVTWASAEPSRGHFDDTYLSSVLAEIADARSRSLGVVLDPGLQYPPAWVFALPGGTRFVDQYGDIYSEPLSSGNDVANAVTNSAVRAAESRYLRGLSAQIPGNLLAAVRTGGGPGNQLTYPGNTYGAHSDCFWAYDPSSQSTSSVPGWQPGTGTTGQARAFLTAYNDNLDAYGAWLDAQTAADFHTEQLIMLPGWGERPGVAHQEVADLLTLDYAEFSQGLDWTDLLPALPNRAQLVAYSTYLDAPKVEPTLQLEDPMSYIAHLAGPLQMALGGENTGQGTVSTLVLVVNRALSLHLVLLDWMDEAQVVAASQGRDPSGPTFANLAWAANQLSKG